MAYVIGSQKGKDIAKNMKTGETYKCSDGSTWTKKSDGSVSVTTSSGNTYNNAYTPSSSGSSSSSSKGSSGGSSSGGSSGGSSNKTGGYSQYTAPTLGDTWDADTDYQAIINNAVDNGDYVTAAKAERLRNQKITQTGVDIAKTNLYKGWLDDTDYSTQMWNGMENGMSAQEMQALYNGRYNKANGTVGLDQYKDDDLMKAAELYIKQQLALEGYENEMNRWEEENQRPTQPESDPRIDKLLNQILNRDDFSYDAANDPLYQQYAEMYRREGDRAMRNAMAEAATGAGGMNTYAMTAAMQANNYYNSQLNDKIPELYQLAYEMYLNDLELKVQDLGILQDMDATQYNRYRDTINDWYADKNFAYNMYNSAVQQGNWQANYDNTNSWNQKYFDNENEWNQKYFDNENYWNEIEHTDNRADVEYERNQEDQAKAQEQLLVLIENGVTPTDKTLIAKAGWTEADVNALIAQVQAEKAGTVGTYRSSGGGSKGGSGGSGGGYEYSSDYSYEATDDYAITNTKDDKNGFIIVSGYGRLSFQEADAMVKNGTLKEVFDHKNKTVTYKKP